VGGGHEVEFGSEKENPSTRAFQRALDPLIKQRSGGEGVPCLPLHGGIGRSVLGNGRERTTAWVTELDG
jgi:hypothetical protein